MTALYVAAAVVVAVAAVLGGAGALARWLYNRGGAEREWKNALEQNTEATRELSQHFFGFRESVVDELHDHDIRLTKLEAKPNGGGSPYRNSRSADGG